MIYDVDIVAVPEQPILSLRERGSLAGIGARMRRLRELAASAGLETTGPMMARFYEEVMPDADVDHDVCIAVRPRADGSVPDVVGEARGEWLPLHHVLEAVHRGPHDERHDVWAALHEARTAVGYAQAGPVTEVYEVSHSDGAQPADYITRVRLPYAR